MRYFELIPSDPTPDIWLFHDPSAVPQRILKQFEPLKCGKCAKIDELEALMHVGVPALHIRTKRDFFGTCDDFNICSDRFVSAYNTESLGLGLLAGPERS